MLQIDSRELSELLLRNPCTLVIDVRFDRERTEFGYIKNSRHIPLYTPDWDTNPDFIEEIGKIAVRDTPLVFVCRSGNRSCEACEMVENHGYSEVYNLSEGYMGLVALKSGAAPDSDVAVLELLAR